MVLGVWRLPVVQNGQVLSLDFLSVAHNKGPFHDVAQFPDVAGPRVLEQGGLRPDGKGFFVLVGLVEFLDDGGGQFGDVQLSLPQRGHPDGKDAQTVVEVLPEGAFGDALLQVSVGGGDDPDVNGNGLAAPHPGDLFFLENPKELGLGGQGELTYFVQENGALVGHLEEARVCPLGWHR